MLIKAFDTKGRGYSLRRRYQRKRGIQAAPVWLTAADIENVEQAHDWGGN